MGLVEVGNTIYARLTAAQTGDNAGQTAALAVLAAAVGTRVYPGISDQNHYPFIDYRVHQEKEESVQVQRQKEYTLTLVIVANGASARVAAGRIQAAVHTLLDRQTWTVSAGLGGGTTRCFLEGADEDVTAVGGNPDALYYELDEEYRVWSNA